MLYCWSAWLKVLLSNDCIKCAYFFFTKWPQTPGHCKFVISCYLCWTASRESKLFLMAVAAIVCACHFLGMPFCLLVLKFESVLVTICPIFFLLNPMFLFCFDKGKLTQCLFDVVFSSQSCKFCFVLILDLMYLT